MENTIHQLKRELQYCSSLTSYSRRKSIEVTIGDVPLGGDNPIRIQSMTTVDTMDTTGSIHQAIRMIEAGSEYVRLTAPSLKEAQNLENIQNELLNRGYTTPLVADIHFTPNAAELAARIVRKVRINPGNYADRKKFEQIEYSDQSYDDELNRIRTKFLPLVGICKEYGTAMRIGTNHGSLSDRIMSRYGDTPLGMVESALEFLRICEDENYHQIVLSMKASNPQVMVQAYRLLVNKMEEEGLRPYPLHLGVTEAGEGEDGRIKSAMGIGTLLEDGLGDTIRVSLTEEPELELPVAKRLVTRYDNRKDHQAIVSDAESRIDPYHYTKRQTSAVSDIGGKNVPRVIADFSHRSHVNVQDLKAIGHYYLPEPDKWTTTDIGVDYIYTGKNKIGIDLPGNLKEIMDADAWEKAGSPLTVFPLFSPDQLSSYSLHSNLNFVGASLNNLEHNFLDFLVNSKNVVLWLETVNEHAMAELRQAFNVLMDRNIDVPVIVSRRYSKVDPDTFQLYASTDLGGLLLDGMGDGLIISTAVDSDSTSSLSKLWNSTAFGILQAARSRITRTEYISCPSCGRTLFDLQETTAMIRDRTDHLKGVKIAIMGCIVNGPGEMADADYGYVGSGPGKITLYKGKEVVKRGIEFGNALDELIDLIIREGDWVDP